MARNAPGKIRLVIADDSPAIRRLLTLLCQEVGGLELAGEAADGLAALEAVRSLRPDVLTLDLNMPRLSGLKVLQALKSEDWPTTIIVLTGLADESYRAKCLAFGADYFFQKGKDLLKVTQVLETLVAQRRASRRRRP